MRSTNPNRFALVEARSGTLELGDRQVIPLEDASRELAPVVDAETRAVLERLPCYGWVEEANQDQSLKALVGMLLSHWQGLPAYREEFQSPFVFYSNFDWAGNLVRAIRGAGMEGAKLFAVSEGQPGAEALVISGREFDWRLHRVTNPGRELPGFALEALDRVGRNGAHFPDYYLAEPGQSYKEELAPVLGQEIGTMVKAALGTSLAAVHAVRHASKGFFSELARQLGQAVELSKANLSRVPAAHHDPVLLARLGGKRYSFFLELCRWE